ncbi:MAG TPA: hypothetical protein VG944_02400 [Fimbriimonas sp.]|nr:hypothetical protein [Fimbriimonas sp.]
MGGNHVSFVKELIQPVRGRGITVIAAVLCILLVGCKPLESQELKGSGRDSTNKMMKQAGGDE